MLHFQTMQSPAEYSNSQEKDIEFVLELQDLLLSNLFSCQNDPS